MVQYNSYNYIHSMKYRSPSFFAFLATYALLLQFPVCANQVSWSDSFENGLGEWNQSGKSISVVNENCFDGTKCVLIQRENSRDMTVISRRFRFKKPGRVTLTARIRAENVSVGEKFYERGKFVTALYEGGRECCWRDDDFDGNVSVWTSRQIIVDDVDSDTSVMLRIGLQNAKGKVYLDAVKVTFVPRESL